MAATIEREPDAEATADLFQLHREELGFVNRAQVREKDVLAMVAEDGTVLAVLLGNHCVRKSQSTVYELATHPDHRREGYAERLVEAFGEDSPHDLLVAKCPVPLPSNEFYRETGWDLVDTEDGKNRDLNVWEYRA